MHPRDLGEHVYSIVAQPVQNPTGEALAHLVSVRDYTESYRAMISNPDHPYSSILKPSIDRAGGSGVLELRPSRKG